MNGLGALGIELVSSEDLATRLGYAGTNAAFRDWCASMRITAVPGRRGYFDPALVRRRLDEAQSLMPSQTDAADSLVGTWRAQRAAR